MIVTAYNTDQFRADAKNKDQQHLILLCDDETHEILDLRRPDGSCMGSVEELREKYVGEHIQRALGASTFAIAWVRTEGDAL